MVISITKVRPLRVTRKQSSVPSHLDDERQERWDAILCGQGKTQHSNL